MKTSWAHSMCPRSLEPMYLLTKYIRKLGQDLLIIEYQDICIGHVAILKIKVTLNIFSVLFVFGSTRKVHLSIYILHKNKFMQQFKITNNRYLRIRTRKGFRAMKGPGRGVYRFYCSRRPRVCISCGNRHICSVSVSVSIF